jgi:hypothetical protein
MARMAQSQTKMSIMPFANDNRQIERQRMASPLISANITGQWRDFWLNER